MDLTGRKQFLRNVVVTWSLQIFVILSGFIIPRQIDEHLGIEELGVWDLGWTTFRYLILVNFGTSAALTRYSAFYKGRGDEAALNGVSSFIVLWEASMALLILVAMYFVTQHTSMLGLTDDYPHGGDLLFLFSLAVAFKLIGDPGGALITGNHRWDIQSTINTAQDVMIAALLVVALIFDGNLLHLGWVVVICTAVTSLTKLVLGFRMWPELEIHPKHLTKRFAIHSIRFGAKSLTNSAPVLIIFQTVSVLVALAGGPAALAIMNRTIALLRICERLVTKVSLMFTPMASGMLGMQQDKAARDLIVQSCKLSMAATLPFCLGLVAYGDFLIDVWMGPDYVNHDLMLVLVLGTFWPIASSGPFGVLAGLDAHGKLGLISIATALLALLAGSLFVSLSGDWTPVMGAAIIGFAWTSSRGIVVPLFLKVRFSIRIWRYAREGFMYPMLANIPLAVGCYFSREALLESDFLIAGTYLAVGGLVSLYLYFKMLIPASVKTALFAKIPGLSSN